MSSTSRRIALASAAPAQFQPLPSSDAGRQRCWECQRRRLVCDGAHPVCGKCKATGVVCPGYDDKKPLTWLAPGKVKVRTWKRKDTQSKAVVTRKAIKEAVEPSSTCAANVRQVHIFPGPELRTETCDMIEAAAYWNSHIYPSFAENQLVPSPFVIPVAYTQFMPPSMLHALVSMAISHRLLRLGSSRTGSYVAEVRSRFHQHRSTAIRCLNEDVNNDLTRSTDNTMSSVLVLLHADIMGPATVSNWRHHINGFMAMVEIRGGMKVFDTTPHLKIVMLFIKIIEIFANTTSPSHDQLSPVFSYNNIDFISKLFETGYYPLLPCPSELFADIVRINRLRFVIATDGHGQETDWFQSTAEELLSRVVRFSPEAWSETKTKSHAQFLLIGKVYQSAVILYALSSLQSLGALPISAGWKRLRDIHYARLFAILETASADPLMRNCVNWPLIVAGFEATSGTTSNRTFVVRKLTIIGEEMGLYLPLAAKDLFQRFWPSGKSQWDECFDRPYALIS